MTGPSKETEASRGDQRHRIRRQIFELTVRGEELASVLQAEMRSIHDRCIVPLLDRCCTELSEPDRVHRIDSLEIDLGTLDADDFENDLVSKLGTLLPQVLAERIGFGEREDTLEDTLDEASETTPSHLELFTFFARTGGLPWWADLSRPVLDESLPALIRDAPGSLARVLAGLARAGGPLLRIVRHYDDQVLSDLVGVLLPSPGFPLADTREELLRRMQEAGILAGQPRARLRDIVWREILRAASIEGPHVREPVAFYRTVLNRVAAQVGVAYTGLLPELRSSTRRARTPLGGIVEELYQDIPEQSAPPPEVSASRPGAPGSHLAEIVETLERLEKDDGPLAGLFGLLRRAAAHLPARYGSQWLSALRDLEGSQQPFAPRDSATERSLLQLLRPALAHQLIAPAALVRLLDELRDPVGTVSPPDGLDELRDPIGTVSPPDGLDELARAIRESLSEEPFVAPTDEASVDPSFSDVEELYVENAGLVILWPFLSRFFENLDFLDEELFKDAASAHRAVGLLQYLATGDPSPREYLLPLNKVLCGMEVTEVFDFGQPVSDREADTCRDLLEAVIVHAPVLKDMSVSGLRGTFLLRKGVLGIRDGAWLLRVERESYDVVLDRFPWDVNWVKQPWMEVPLRVEW